MAARTFADARAGDVILYEDSYRNMSVAITGGNAAALLHVSPATRSGSATSILERLSGPV